jgi:hypothetical protein
VRRPKSLRQHVQIVINDRARQLAQDIRQAGALTDDLGRTLGHAEAQDVALAVVDTLDRAVDAARRLTSDYVGALTHVGAAIRDRTVGSSLVDALVLARANGRSLTNALVRTRTRTLTDALVRARDRAHEFAAALGLDNAITAADVRFGALTVAYVLADDFANAAATALDRDLDLARDVALDVGRVISMALDMPYPFHVGSPSDRTVGRLLSIADDFTEADLRHVNLTGVALEGLRWSVRTLWPDQWRERIERDTVPLGGELYEIRPGSSSAGDDLSVTPR